MNNSKVEYLKRYGQNNTKKKKKKERKLNLSIIDDDCNWKTTFNAEPVLDNDSDEGPIVAEVHDESVIKWQPLSMVNEDKSKQSDLSPPRKASRINIPYHQNSEEVFKDASPPRRSQENLSLSAQVQEDESPPRRTQRCIEGHLHPPKRALENSNSPGTVEDSSPPRTVEYVVNSLRKHHNNVEKLQQDNKTIYRDKNGKRIERDHRINETRSQEQQEFMEWGRGVVQSKTIAEKIQDEEYEMSKPLARYADDDDLEKMLKERTREGDPMLMFKKKKKSSITKHIKEKPQYRGYSAPNRFVIRPGYRWDGVNRSNGYEQLWFSKSSNKKAIAEESYKWSVEDM